MPAVQSLDAVRAAQAPAPDSGRITRETVQRYLMDIRPGIKPTTFKSYRTCLSVFLIWLQARGISTPQAQDILQYKDHLAEDGIAAGTRRQYIRLVQRFFNWTAKAGLYPDVAIHVQGIRIRVTGHSRDALGPDDVQAIAASIDRSTAAGLRLYAIFLLCVSAGLRMIEVSRANIGDIRQEGGRLYLYVQGKGHDEPDTPVLLADEVADAIRAYLATRADACLPRAPLFASTSNSCKGQRIAPTTISTQLKRAMIAAGYSSSRITAHSLRHTSGTAVYKATRNLYLTQQHQRHMDPATTEIYLHAEERSSRITEQLALDYLMHGGTDQDPRDQARRILDALPPDKVQQAITLLNILA